MVFGIGNPGRRDDGLGEALVRRLEAAGLPGVTAEACYQLQVEDSLACADADIAVFADAARDQAEAVRLEEIAPAPIFSVTTHAMRPEAVLAVCAEIRGRVPRAFVLAMRGSDWEIGEGLSPDAERVLEEALAVLSRFIEAESAAG